MHIFLIGYMGSGKSTVGKLLAAQSQMDFLDLDTYIEEKEAMSVTELFAQKGEIYFRKKEHLYLKEILAYVKDKPCVVSLGGGTPCYAGNMDLLKASAVNTIYLNVALLDLVKRLWGNKVARPLLARFETKEGLEDYVRKHLFERGYYYNQANKVLKIEGTVTPQQIVDQILQELF